MKKYNKINKTQVEILFDDLKPLSKKDISTILNTSLYQVIRIIEELKDDNYINVVELKENYNVPIRKYIKKCLDN